MIHQLYLFTMTKRIDRAEPPTVKISHTSCDAGEANDDFLMCTHLKVSESSGVGNLCNNY